MLQFSRWQTGFIAFLGVLGAYCAVPNVFAAEETPWGFPSWSRVTLALDLHGGSHLLLDVDTDDALASRIQGTVAEVRRALRDGSDGGRVRFSVLGVSDEGVRVQITDPDDIERAQLRLRRIGQPLGGAFAGGARDIEVSREEGGILTVRLTEEARAYFADAAVADSIEVVRRRIDALGTKEPLIARQGEGRLVVQVPGDDDPEALKNVVARTGQLTFHMVDFAADPAAPLPPGRDVVPYERRDGMTEFVVIEDEVLLTGANITDASASPDPERSGFQVNITMDGKGQRRFRDVTTNFPGRSFAIVLDEEAISVASINEPINTPRSRITGNFTPDVATELSVLIRAGALPAPLTVIEQRTVDATLGADSVRAGATALMIGFVGVIAFIVVTYGRFGIYADFALLANVLLIAGALSLLGATLTLPGIAGIVLTIGMAVDANVLIFERIREELKAGKKPVVAVEQGYKHAWSAIFDANLTTLIAAAIMFMLGAGPVRGFAVTLGIGVVTSVFTAFVLTRVFAGGYVLSRRPKALAI